MRNNGMKKQNTLYYDGACPLCSAEMNRLQRLSDDGLCLIDVHSAARDTLPEDPHRLLEVLHMETADGRLLTGVDANVAAWQHTRWGLLFRWMRWPVIRSVADFVYGIWARRRYNKMYPGE